MAVVAHNAFAPVMPYYIGSPPVAWALLRDNEALRSAGGQAPGSVDSPQRLVSFEVMP